MPCEVITHLTQCGCRGVIGDGGVRGCGGTAATWGGRCNACHKRVASGPTAYLHDPLHERLGAELLVLGGQAAGDAQFVAHREQLVLLVVHRSLDDIVDGLVDELHKAADIVVGLGLLPLVRFGVQEVLTPEAVKPLLVWGGGFGGIRLGKLRDRESPGVQASREGHCTLQSHPSDEHHGFTVSRGTNNRCLKRSAPSLGTWHSRPWHPPGTSQRSR